ncbi:MAG: hypothetical protein JW917_05460 [Ignavibacteria bacterium]|nr:hypothetical protein [Ignavibacteria bacterium]
MKTSMLFFLFIGLIFCGCQDLSQDISAVNSDKVPVPYKRSFEGIATTLNPSPFPDPVPVELTLTGTGTHVGKYTASYNYDLSFDAGYPPPWGDILNGYGGKISANGDEIYNKNLHGEWWVVSTTEIEYWIESDIDGGTGRF